MDFGDLYPPDFTSITQGIALAQRMRQQQAMTEQQEMNLQKQREEMERDRAYQQELMRIMNNPQSTEQDLMRLAMMNPAQSKQTMQLLQMHQQQGGQADIQAIMQASIAAENGDYETAMAIVDKAEQAAANSGRQSGIAGLGGIMRQNPTLAGNLLRQYMLYLDPERMYKVQKAMDMGNKASVSGSNAFFQDGLNSEKVRLAQANANKAEIAAQNEVGKGSVIEAQANAYNARAQQANQPAGNAGGGGQTGYGNALKLGSVAHYKEVKDSGKEANKLLENKANLRLIREEMEALDTGIFDAGFQRRAIESIKRTFGLQDNESLARIDSISALMKEMLKNRAPGSTSNYEQKLLQATVPDPNNISPANIAAWFERMEEISEARYIAQSLNTTILAEYGYTAGAANHDAIVHVDGQPYKIKKGTDLGRVIDAVRDNALQKVVARNYEQRMQDKRAEMRGKGGAGGKYSAQHGSKWGQ